MWSFSDEMLQEVKTRFEEGRGYNYWDKFYLKQPDVMIAAECTLEKISNPFLPKVAKKYQCPTGEFCLNGVIDNCKNENKNENCKEK